METTARLEAYIAGQIEARPIEAQIIRKIVSALAEAGTPVTKTWDTVDIERVKTEQEILTVAFNLDEVYLLTGKGSWVRLTMGEEWDLICDYTTNLEEALKPVMEWIARNEG